MPFIEWTPEFSVGQKVLDADHRKLIDILNQIYDAWQEHSSTLELGRLFDELMDYTDNHFTREESKLSAHDYDDLTRHHAAHERLRELVMAFRSRHLAGQQADKLTEEMAKFLKSWLLDHILEEDMKYRKLFTGS
ncbi:MAG: hemerythrin family protein [Rhodospirillaceae bacterium]|nr:hemerythrin family protein [Rhodospirillales bacterium]